MTGFELYLESLGYTLVSGLRRSFSTYDNCHRVWTSPEGGWISVGLYKPAHAIEFGDTKNYDTQIGVMTIDYMVHPMPSEDQYQHFTHA